MKSPDSVAILGLGPSLESYVDCAKRLGDRRKMFDEVWGINAVLNVIQCDRGFHLDDIRVQEIRAAANPNTNIAAMLPWLRTHPGPIYTSVPHPDYPGMVAYPLQDVMNSCGKVAYFNSTAAYAVAYAVHLNVKKLYVFGCDFSYPDVHKAEAGRACVEFYLGMGKGRGMTIGLPKTALMDGTTTDNARLYGYDGAHVSFKTTPTGNLKLKFTPQELPTAEVIEARYDHNKRPAAVVR